MLSVAESYRASTSEGLITRRSPVQIRPPQPAILVHHLGLLKASNPFLFGFRFISVQNSAQLLGKRSLILNICMSVCLQHETRVGPPAALLPNLQRNAKPIHQTRNPMTEGMEPSFPNPQRTQQRPQLPLHHKPRIPRRAPRRREKQAPLIRSPRSQKTLEMLDKLRREHDGTVGILRLGFLNTPAPNTLPDLDH